MRESNHRENKSSFQQAFTNICFSLNVTGDCCECFKVISIKWLKKYLALERLSLTRYDYWDYPRNCRLLETLLSLFLSDIKVLLSSRGSREAEEGSWLHIQMKQLPAPKVCKVRNCFNSGRADNPLLLESLSPCVFPLH